MSKRIEHKVIDGVEYKWCFKCKSWKPLSEFGKRKRNWDELFELCKECNKQDCMQRYTNNPDNWKQYRVSHPEYNKQNNIKYYSKLKGFCMHKYHSHLATDVNKGFFTKETVPPNYITPQILMELYQQPDYYDGKLYYWSLMSVDRMDNDKPHTLDNIVVCTWEHNDDRQRKRMSVEEYRKFIQQKMQGN